MLARNVEYNDRVGSSSGAGYIGGFIGGCQYCMNGGCMHCMRGCGYIGGAKPSKGLRQCVDFEMGPKGKKRCKTYAKKKVNCVKSEIGPKGKKRCLDYELGSGYIGGFKGERAVYSRLREECPYELTKSGKHSTTLANRSKRIECINSYLNNPNREFINADERNKIPNNKVKKVAQTALRAC
jgi:hypothetical protein